MSACLCCIISDDGRLLESPLTTHRNNNIGHRTRTTDRGPSMWKDETCKNVAIVVKYQKIEQNISVCSPFPPLSKNYLTGWETKLAGKPRSKIISERPAHAFDASYDAHNSTFPPESIHPTRYCPSQWKYFRDHGHKLSYSDTRFSCLFLKVALCTWNWTSDEFIAFCACRF